MPEQIISASGTQFPLIVNPDGSLNTQIIGSIVIGSVSANVDSIYVQSGNDMHLGSAWSRIGSILITNNPVPVSGNLGVSGTAFNTVWVGTGSVVISGGTVGSFAITTNPVPISGQVLSKGLTGNQIIRKNSGSPAVNYVFSAIAESFLIDNLGSSPIYFALNATANPANSGTGFIDLFTFRSFDGQVGSISIQGSGITSPSIQVIRLT